MCHWVTSWLLCTVVSVETDSRHASVVHIVRLESPRQVCVHWTWCCNYWYDPTKLSNKYIFLSNLDDIYMWFSTQHLVTLATYICDLVHNIWMKGVARIRDVGCAHPGFAPYLARICCPIVRCVLPSKWPFWLRALVQKKKTFACIRFRNDSGVHPFSSH